tara:strand:- start:394 stop:4782 length:4389 start_codon:yes stop_codon:yes gene_type:complete
MACRFRYWANGVERKLYADLYGYLDTTSPEKKNAESIYKILKKNGIAVRVHGAQYLNQANVQHSLLEISRINNEYPGLLSTQYIKMTPKTEYSRAAELHSLDINEYILKQIPIKDLEDADFVSNNETEIDQYVRFVAGKEDTRDYYLDELARQENTSDQSRFSDMEKESIDRVKAKVIHLKESFAKAGVTVDVEYNSELDSIAEVKSGEVNPIIIINPNLVKEDTAYHEFGHIYIDMLGITDPTVASAILQLRDTYLYKQVQEMYPELTGERLDKEVLATAIGLEGAKITRKDPSWVQQLVNRIMRAFGKIFGVKPNAASIIAQEMFAKKLRAESMLNPLSPYTQQSKEEENFSELVNNLKVRIASEIYEIEQLPTEEREKKIYEFQKLQKGLAKINKIEDLLATVDTMGRSLLNAIKKYDSIMDLPLKERSTLESMNSIYELKTELDALDVLKPIKSILLVKKKEGKILEAGNFEELEQRLRSILDNAEVYNEKFKSDIIPVMAQFLSGYHNKSLDAQLQAQIDNTIEKKRTMGLNKQTDKYRELKSKYDKDQITKKEFIDEQVKLNVEQLKNEQIPNYSSLVKNLEEAHKDKSGFSYFFDPLIYSNDKAIQLFVKSIQDADLKKNDMTREFKSKLSAQYEEFSAGMSESDVAKLNEDLLEEVIVDGMPRLALVNPIDVNKYYKEQKEFINKINNKYGKPKKENYKDEEVFKSAFAEWANKPSARLWRQEKNKWISRNSEEVEGWEKESSKLNNQIKQAKSLRAELDRKNEEDKSAYENLSLKIETLVKLRRKNTFEDSQGIHAAGDWVQPKKSLYTNKKYTKIQSNPKLKKYYNFVLQEFQNGHQMIGHNRLDKNSWDSFSYLMPSIRKQDIDRAREQGVWTAIKDKLKDSFTITETNDEYGTYDQNTGELTKRVPVYYVNKVSARDVSKDIASSLYQFRHMTHNYKVKSEALGHVMLFKDIIKNRELLQENSSGIELIQKTAENLGYKMYKKKEGSSSYNFKHIDEWIDVVMFGQYELKQKFKGISATKAVGALNSFTALNTLSFNLLQGANQLILDNLSMVQEAIAGQFMSKSDLAWAKSKYWLEAGAMTDIGRFNPKTKLGKAIEYFDALTEFTDHEGNTLVGGKARKFLSTNNLLFLQQAAEHELSATRLLGLLRSLKGKLKDSNGNILKNETGQDADLYDMLIIDKNGVMSIDSRVDNKESNFNRLNFIGLVQGLSRRTNQTKGKMHSPMISRRAYGKLFMLFRSWVMPGIRRRYGHGGGSSLHIDEELGTVTQGMYISFYNMFAESISKRKLIYSDMTQMEKQNVKRTFVELASMIAAGVLVNALAGLDDDDETWVSNFTLYQAKRYHTEIMQWNPAVGWNEMLRIMRSPTATARPIEKGIELMGQIATDLQYFTGMPWSDKKDVYYQKRTGRFEKGDRKIRKDFEDLMIGWRGISRSINKGPKEAYKWFTTLE